MNVSKRIRMCRMIEKMDNNKELSKRLGLKKECNFINNKKNKQKGVQYEN